MVVLGQHYLVERAHLQDLFGLSLEQIVIFSQSVVLSFQFSHFIDDVFVLAGFVDEFEFDFVCVGDLLFDVS